jgi:anti-sigma factor RsiW
VSCEALINKFLMDYCAGTLPVTRKLEFDFHLSLCKDCRRYLDSYRKTIQLAKAAGSEQAPIPDELINAVLKTIDSARIEQK